MADDTLTHVAPDGTARMVDVSDKPTTTRVAVARAVIEMASTTSEAIASASIAKGDVIAVARLAGVMAAKRTGDLIPLCHPLALDHVDVDAEVAEGRVILTATARTTARTGVEMEAMTAVSVAALTIYDMIKAVDRSARIDDIRVVRKEGGKTGLWVR